MCAITKYFGYEDLPEELIVAGGTTIHGLDNVMTLEPSIRAWFEALELWFEAIVSNNSKLSYIFRPQRH